jgi:CMP/dCMP kinase
LNKIVIAIDGPSGSGKSTIAKGLSEKYKIHYLDTGAMYRAVALKVLRAKVDVFHTPQMMNLLKELYLKIVFIDGFQRTILDEEDVTEIIRTEEVSLKASDVATIPQVRLKLVELQRHFGLQNGCVMDGRDIGTYVFPNADYKFYLTASIEERAKRRYKEYLEKGLEINLERIKIKLEERDRQDRERDFAPLKKAEDAYEIDTSGLEVERVLEKICSYLNESQFNGRVS